MPAWTISPTQERSSALSSANHGRSDSIRCVAAGAEPPGRAAELSAPRAPAGSGVGTRLQPTAGRSCQGICRQGICGRCLFRSGVRVVESGQGRERGGDDAEQGSGPAEVEFVTVHGKRRAFVKTGSGPALLLLHGLACDRTTWDRVIPLLAKKYTVIAPDLLGHGLSDKPRADYTLGGYANGMRDLLTVLGIDKVTVVGHSFGGGVAMQFAYQFPERTQRVMLVSSGGLGPEVTPLIELVQAARVGAGHRRR